MKKYLLTTTTLLIAFALTAFDINENRKSKKNVLTLIQKTHLKKSNPSSWTIFEYIGGPQYNPNSYVKVTYFVYLSDYCPGNENLCGILAEEDLHANLGHPTQASLNYLLTYFGFYYHFPYEVPGLIEFKWQNQ